MILESTNSIAFCIATVIGATLVLGAVDWRLSLLLAVWLVGYGFFIRWYLPRIRRLSRTRAEARGVQLEREAEAAQAAKEIRAVVECLRSEAGQGENGPVQNEIQQLQSSEEPREG